MQAAFSVNVKINAMANEDFSRNSEIFEFGSSAGLFDSGRGSPFEGAGVSENGDAGSRLDGFAVDLFAEPAAGSDEAQLLAASQGRLSQLSDQSSSDERADYRDRHGFDAADGFNGRSWEQYAQQTFEAQGKAHLLGGSPDDPLPETAPSGSGGMTFQDTMQAIEEIKQRYEQETQNSTPTAEVQKQYVDEQLQVLEAYKRNPGDTPGVAEQMSIERAQGFLGAERDILEAATPAPQPAEAPIGPPPPPENTGEGEPGDSPAAPGGEDSPGEGDPDDDDDGVGEVARPNPDADPAPTGGTVKSPLDPDPEISRPNPDNDLDAADGGDDRGPLNGGFGPNPNLIRPTEDGFVEFEFDDRGPFGGFEADPNLIRPAEDVIEVELDPGGRVFGGRPSVIDPNPNLAAFDLEEFGFSENGGGADFSETEPGFADLREDSFTISNSDFDLIDV